MWIKNHGNVDLTREGDLEELLDYLYMLEAGVRDLDKDVVRT